MNRFELGVLKDINLREIDEIESNCVRVHINVNTPVSISRTDALVTCRDIWL